MLELVIEARRKSLGALEVGRILPFMKRRMVGPFIFLDHIGPLNLPPEVPRKPINATLSRTAVRVERRGHRLVPAPCAACGRDDLRVMLRTDYVVYFRCEHCLQVWSVAKPGEEFGT